MLRKAAVLFGVMVALAMTPAGAHKVERKDYVFGTAQASSTCVWVESTIDHGANRNGYQRGAVATYDVGPEGPCTLVSHRDLAMYEILWKLDDGNDCSDPNNGWCECTDWGFFYAKGTYKNPNQGYVLAKSWTYGDVPCGSGTYGVTVGGWGWVSEANEWRGGWLWSGSHALPVGAPNPGPSSPNLSKIASKYLPSSPAKPGGRIPLPSSAVPM